jgi:hypothetical protein
MKWMLSLPLMLALGFPFSVLLPGRVSPLPQENKNDFDPGSNPQVTTCPPVVGTDGESPYLFGVLNDEGKHYADERERGVRATTFELQWRLYEPARHLTMAISLICRRFEWLTAGLVRAANPCCHYVPVGCFRSIQIFTLSTNLESVMILTPGSGQLPGD